MPPLERFPIDPTNYINGSSYKTLAVAPALPVDWQLLTDRERIGMARTIAIAYKYLILALV